MLDDARQVADAVGVGILKGTRVNLIDDAMLPPKFLLCHALLLGNLLRLYTKTTMGFVLR
jgi:hypothetical protein